MKSLPRLAALVLGLALFGVAASGFADPPDSTGTPGLLVRVTTDKPLYAPGEPVKIQVVAMNASRDPVVLQFASGYHADYALDDAYVWSANKDFIQVPSQVTLAPGEMRVLLGVVHDAQAYPLKPGPHVLVGKVVGYGGSRNVFLVGPEAGMFAVRTEVEPPRAPVGTPLGFRFTVTNVSNHEASFTADGCPVLYEIHSANGSYMPMVACPAVIQRFNLKAGESLSFGPDNYSVLVFHPESFPLPPGESKVVMGIRGVGEASAAFGVLPPRDGLAYLAGRLLGPDREPLPEGMVYLSQAPVRPDSVSPPPEAIYKAQVLRDGWFYFVGVKPGRYFLQAEAQGRMLWYPGTPDPSQAQPVGLGPDTYRDDVRFVFSFPEPPPPGPFVIRGEVREVSFIPEGNPLAGALVMAVPAAMDVPPVPEPWVGGSLPPDPTRLPSPAYATRTGPDGQFLLNVPAGTYRLFAARPEMDTYQYWDHAKRFDEASLLTGPVPGKGPERFYRFDLFPAMNAPPAVITGIVISDDPLLDRPAVPIAGAEIVAIPIVPQLAMMGPDSTGFEALRTRTKEDGTYALAVPAGTPYLVWASAKDHEPRFYPQATRPEDAMWVDVAPKETTAGIDFTLQPVRPPETRAAIEGFAMRELPPGECSATTPRLCLVPAAGAVVIVTPAFPTFAAVEYRAIAGRDGRFRVEGMMGDDQGLLSYYVMVEYKGYEPAFYPEGVPREGAVPLPVWAGKISDAGRILLTLPRPDGPGFVGGRVLGLDDQPIAGAMVRVYPEPENPRGPVLATRTDEKGGFHVAGLPEGLLVIVSAEARGYVPAYYPNAHRWKEADRVSTGGPYVRMAPVIVRLASAASGGPFIQAGLVHVETFEDGTTSNPPSLPGGGGDRMAEDMARELGAQALALAYNEQNLPDAFFYLENAYVKSFPPPIVAGGSSGSNGAVILTGLPAGGYRAFADRPGFETSYFWDDRVMTPLPVPRLIELNATTPAILAEIRLRPVGNVDSTTTPGTDAAAPVRRLRNVPNPFTASTTIQYTLDEAVPVVIEVFDAAGRQVRRILGEVNQSAGDYAIPWDRTDDSGRRVGAGIYFSCVRAGHRMVAQKVVVLP